MAEMSIEIHQVIANQDGSFEIRANTGEPPLSPLWQQSSRTYASQEDMEAARLELQDEDTMFAMALNAWSQVDANYGNVSLAAGISITV